MEHKHGEPFQANCFRIIWARDHVARATDQCDCACVDTPVVACGADAIPVRVGARYRAEPVMLMLLADDWHLAVGPQAAIVPVVVNAPALELLGFFQTPHSLADASDAFGGCAPGQLQFAVRQLLATELLTDADFRPVELPQTGSTLTAWLHITNACNLRCAYCYLDKTPNVMSFEIGRRAIDAVVRSALRHNYSGIKLKYAGGEPVLQLPLVLQLHEYARNLAERNQLALHEVVLSNGTRLTTQSIEQLKARGIRLMISLDGIGGYHDLQRKFANGAGSFDLVSRNIDLAQAQGLVPDVCITVSGRNGDGLPEIMKYVLDRDLPFTLNFYRENDCSVSVGNLRIDEQRIVAAMRETYKIIEANLPRRSLLSALIDRASFVSPHNHTCGVGRDYLVIDHTGHIAKCQMEISKTVTDVRADDPLRIVRTDQTGIQNINVDEKEGCRECEWKYWCAGGCPLATFRATGRYDAKSPNCSIYKMLYPEVLKLEGLRLLKYHAHVDG